MRCVRACRGRGPRGSAGGEGAARALRGGGPLQVKWNVASGAPTTPTGNDYELVCEIILDTAASHSS